MIVIFDTQILWQLYNKYKIIGILAIIIKNKKKIKDLLLKSKIVYKHFLGI